MIKKLAGQTVYDRVILAEQHAGCDYGDIDKLQEELQYLSFRFRPLDADKSVRKFL